MSKIIIILISISILFTLPAFAKKIPKSGYEIVLKSDDGTIRAMISSEYYDIRLKTDRFYCGYYLNNVFCKQGELEGKALNGRFIKYDFNENIIESGNYKMALKNGLWKTHSSDGFLLEVRNYRNGLLQGKKVIYKKGKPDIIEKYKKDKLIGNPRNLNLEMGNMKDKSKEKPIKKLLQKFKK